jgi:ATP-dependent RNA helicase DDX21
VFSYFEAAAKELLLYFEGDAKKALECAMAKICDTTKPLPSRSLLTANDGFITLHFMTQNSIRNVGYIKSILQKQFPDLAYDDTIGWRMTADSKGVVVDVKESKIKIKDNEIWISDRLWQNGKGVNLQVAKELPELAASYGSGSGSNSNGRGGFGTRGRGGFRGHSNGRGRSSSRGGHRGGYHR